MVAKKQNPGEVAIPEEEAEPDYTGLEQYIIPAPRPDQPPNWDAPGVKRLPPEQEKLTVEESLQLLKHLPLAATGTKSLGLVIGEFIAQQEQDLARELAVTLIKAPT